MNDSPFVTAEQLAKVLPVSAWWLKAQARKVGLDVLPSYHAKRVMFDLAEAIEWYKRTQRRPAGPRVPVRRLRRQRKDAGTSRSLEGPSA